MSAPLTLSIPRVVLLAQLAAASRASVPLVSLGRLRVVSDAQTVAAPAHLDDARRQFDAGRYAEAAGTLESVVAGDARNADAYFWLGRARFELRQYVRAVVAFARAADLGPQASEHHRWLGRAYGEQAEAERSFSLARKSRHQFEEAVRLTPSSIPARRDLMEFYIEAPRLLGGGREKAWRQADAIAAIDSVAGHLARAAIWSRQHDAEGTGHTRAEYRAALEAAPHDLGPYFEAAEFYVGRKDVEGLRAAVAGATRAAQASDKASHLAGETKSQIDEIRYFEGVLHVIAGDTPRDAEAALRSYVNNVPPRSDRPSQAAAHEWLGRLYESEHRPDLAAAEYREALRLEPDRQGARERLEKLK